MNTPAAIHIEKMTLAAILCKPQLLELAQSSGIDAECFFSTDYRKIWEAILKLTANGNRLDDVVLINEMPGNAPLIGELVSETIATTANFNQWLEKLREYKARRLLLRESYDRQKMLSENGALAEILAAHEAAGLAARSIIEAGKQHGLDEAVADALDAIDHPHPCLPIFPNGTEAAAAFKLHAGEFFVIGARTGNGKTALAAQMTCEMLRADKVVLYACSESSASDILLRLAAALTGIPHYAVENGRVNEKQKTLFREAVARLGKCPRLQIIGCDGALMTAARICNALKSFRLRQGHVDAVVVDFVQNISPAPEDGRKSRLDQINNAIQRLHDVFIEEHCTGIVLSQFNRGALNQDVAPDLKDLKDTSNLEQLATTVAFLHRAAPDDPQSIFYTRKTRNQASAKILLTWNGAGYDSAPEYSVVDRPLTY